ncbi:MAG TPA: exodeoxyribonuclease VII small subunit [Spirochaetota bacterium]|nr:exodeoxyribonuclease VII small subunit [Spirochaetota bacterium]HPJ37482.1 exodeoxyribonuclease VII small subunit [Spirochaetota bacterium]HPQ51847.1 exodeoxyribonuclease VII small subunit [Spirochaetota bacterium]
MEKKKTKPTLTFEHALKQLEEITDNLERGALGLDESIAEFEKGIKLARFCHGKLEEAEKKIEILQKGDDGKIAAKEVKVKNESGEIDDDDVDLQGTLL